MNKIAEKTDEFILIGDIKSAYGIKGWVRLYSYTEPKEAIFDYQPWLIKKEDRYQPLTFESGKKHGKGLVVKLAEIKDRTIAETYQNTPIYIKKSSLPKTQTDEYYWSDLVGMRVLLATGENIGVVESLFETGAHAVLNIQPDAQSIDNETRLVPWHHDVIVNVDENKQQIILDWFLDY